MYCAAGKFGAIPGAVGLNPHNNEGGSVPCVLSLLNSDRYYVESLIEHDRQCNSTIPIGTLWGEGKRTVETAPYGDDTESGPRVKNSRRPVIRLCKNVVLKHRKYCY